MWIQPTRCWFRRPPLEGNKLKVLSCYYAGLHKQNYGWVFICSVQNGKFRWSFRIANPITQNALLDRSLCGIPDRQSLALLIVKETGLSQSKCFKLVATAGYGYMRCVQGDFHVGLCCTAWRRPALSIMEPFGWKWYSLSGLPFADSGSSPWAIHWLVLIYGCKTLVVEMTFRSMTGPTLDKGAVWARNPFSDQTWQRWHCSLLPLHRYILLGGSCWRINTVLKNICSIVGVVVLFSELCREKQETKDCWYRFIPDESHAIPAKDSIRCCSKTGYRTNGA